MSGTPLHLHRQVPTTSAAHLAAKASKHHFPYLIYEWNFPRLKKKTRQKQFTLGKAPCSHILIILYRIKGVCFTVHLIILWSEDNSFRKDTLSLYVS